MRDGQRTRVPASSSCGANPALKASSNQCLCFLCALFCVFSQGNLNFSPPPNEKHALAPTVANALRFLSVFAPLR